MTPIARPHPRMLLVVAAGRQPATPALGRCASPCVTSCAPLRPTRPERRAGTTHNRYFQSLPVSRNDAICTAQLQNPHSVRLVDPEKPPASAAIAKRFRALALFGRRPSERVDGPGMPASENLHISGKSPPRQRQVSYEWRRNRRAGHAAKG
jgi:hypothetical protein